MKELPKSFFRFYIYSGDGGTGQNIMELMQQKLTSFAELIDICHSRGADRADAVARAMFAYRVAYVKTLYTIEFMTAMLNSYNEDGARAKLESIFFTIA